MHKKKYFKHNYIQIIIFFKYLSTCFIVQKLLANYIIKEKKKPHTRYNSKQCSPCDYFANTKYISKLDDMKMASCPLIV